MPNGLGGAMRDMGAVMQRLAKEVADPAQKDAALTDVILMQRDAAIAKTGIPNNVRNLTGDDKAKKLGEFRADMTKLVKALLDFEDNIAAGNADAIKASEAKLGDIMKAGHAEFKPEE
jgi:soluble cytochrome b562